MLSSRMRIVVMCFKLTSPFPRDVGSKGCPLMQTDCTGRASGHFSKALATQKAWLQVQPAALHVSPGSQIYVCCSQGSVMAVIYRVRGDPTQIPDRRHREAVPCVLNW